MPEENPVPAERAPEAPSGGWSGWGLGSDVTVGGDGPGTTLRARSAHPVGLPVPGPCECPPRANKARFDLYFSKVSQNREVSPKSRHKASHSPYFQNGPGKSPLEIPRFPFSPAFSHKELMGLF